MLEEANPPDPVPADPAGGKVGDTPVRKPKPCVGDIYSPGQDQYPTASIDSTSEVTSDNSTSKS